MDRSVTIRKIIFAAIDPLILVEPMAKHQIERDATSLLHLTIYFNFSVWTFIWTLTIFFNDWNKPNFSAWVHYRLTVLASFLVLLIIFHIFKKIKGFPYLVVMCFAGIHSIAYSWSYALGEAMQRELITVCSVLTLATCIRSFFLNVTTLAGILFLSKGFWQSYVNPAWVFTDYEISIFFLMFTSLGHASIIKNKETSYLLAEMQDQKLKQERAQSELSRKRFKVASQVAHDIRSPIAALKVIFNDSSGLSEDEKIIGELALHRIDGIAKDVLGEHRMFQKYNDQVRYSLILPVLDSIFKEKQIEYRRQVSLILLKQDIFPNQVVRFEEHRLRRIFSNLINNACEAMDYKGEIEIRIQDSLRVVLISIRDQGKGMSSETLARIREGNFVSDKPYGNGLGLSDVAEQVQLWGGQLTIKSQLNQGTVVTLALQKAF